MKNYFILASVCLLFSAVGCSVFYSSTVRDLDSYCPEVALNEGSQRNRVLQHTVMLRSGRSKGAGIVLEDSENKYTVVTAKHVIASNNEVEALRYLNKIDNNSLMSFQRSKRTSGSDNVVWDLGEVVWQHPSDDIAVLEINKISSFTVPSDMYRCMLSKEFSKDASIYHVGYRGNGWDISESPGDVADVKDDTIAFKSNDFLPGQSGGAILNDAWQIVGMGISAAFIDQERGNSGNDRSYNIALRIDYVLSELVKNDYFTKYSTGIPSQDLKGNTAKHDNINLISTLLNDYYFKAADLIVVLEQGGITSPEIDPTYQGREQKYNIAHDELVNRYSAIRKIIASNWNTQTVQKYDETFKFIRGVSNDPKGWSMGDIGVHSVIYNGLEYAIGWHNENNGNGIVPRWVYSDYLAELNLQMPILKTKIDALLADLD